MMNKHKTDKNPDLPMKFKKILIIKIRKPKN